MTRLRSSLLVTWIAFGYAFLYIPIAVLILYSFNDSQLVAVWSHFSTRWYGELLKNGPIREAAWLSLRIAVSSATAATILGTLAALALQRGANSTAKSLREGFVMIPVILPEVLSGLSLLLLFVFLGDHIGWPQSRGALTITIAHITFGMAYACIVVRARLSQLDPVLDEAAADLGASPPRVFLRITLPLLTPAMAAAWLLTFTLSLDDVVIASFVSGPGASTLPMVILSSVKLGVSPQVNALATLLVLFVAILVLSASLLMRKIEIR